jgi:hypothetical protein
MKEGGMQEGREGRRREKDLFWDRTGVRLPVLFLY